VSSIRRLSHYQRHGTSPCNAPLSGRGLKLGRPAHKVTRTVQSMKPACRRESAAERTLGRPRHRAPRLLSQMTAAAFCISSLLLAGCQSTAGENGGGLFSSATAPAMNAARKLWSGIGDDSTRNVLAQASNLSAEGRRKLKSANRLFDVAEYADAASQYKQLAEEYEGTSVGEEAQFQLAESWYALKRYPMAQDGYDRLFTDYPSTRYVQLATKRLYAIAQNWLDATDPAHRSRIHTVSAVQVAYEAPDEIPLPSNALSLRYRILPNFRDKSRPVFDTQGRAIKALKSIWLNDPTGPMTPDALFATATYYLRQKDYVEADRYFNILRDEYPDNPHIKDAFLLGSHVRLMSYQGPSYDGTSLEGANQLTAQSLKMFPNSRERPQLRTDLKKIHLLKAQRIWHRVLYYEKKKNSDRAVGLTCVQLINEFPNTQFADMARDRLATLDRNELNVLPGFDRILESLPEKRSRIKQPNGKVKSVSTTADGTNGHGGY